MHVSNWLFVSIFQTLKLFLTQTWEKNSTKTPQIAGKYYIKSIPVFVNQEIDKKKTQRMRVVGVLRLGAVETFL